jgi:hypothetical protein
MRHQTVEFRQGRTLFSVFVNGNWVMLGRAHKENRGEAGWFAPEKALQASWQANPTKLLARWPPQYGLQRMLSNQGSATTQQATL